MTQHGTATVTPNQHSVEHLDLLPAIHRELQRLKELLEGRGTAGADGSILLTPPQAAHRLGVSLRQVENFIAKGELASVKLGASRRIDSADLDRFIEDRKGRADASA